MVSDFTPSEEVDGELEVEEGEEVIIEAIEEGLDGARTMARIRTYSGEVGLVPMEHLERVPQAVNGLLERTSSDAGAVEDIQGHRLVPPSQH